MCMARTLCCQALTTCTLCTHALTSCLTYFLAFCRSVIILSLLDITALFADRGSTHVWPRVQFPYTQHLLVCVRALRRHVDTRTYIRVTSSLVALHCQTLAPRAGCYKRTRRSLAFRHQLVNSMNQSKLKCLSFCAHVFDAIVFLNAMSFDVHYSLRTSTACYSNSHVTCQMQSVAAPVCMCEIRCLGEVLRCTVSQNHHPKP